MRRDNYAVPDATPQLESIWGGLTSIQIMPFSALELRIEDADQNQIYTRCRTQEVPIVFFEHIDIALADRIDISLHVFDFALAINAITRLEMIFVFEQGFRSLTHDCMTNGKTHFVRFHQHSMAGAISPIDEAVALLNITQTTLEHELPFLLIKTHFINTGLRTFQAKRSLKRRAGNFLQTNNGQCCHR